MVRSETLLTQLRSYEPGDELEAGHLRAMIELLATAADPFSRDSFSPGHFTASCFIVDDGARLLLHHHRRLGKWLQMGGHVDGDEFPDAAALREGAEESGLADLQPVGGIVDLDIHAIPAGRGEPDHHHFDVRYVARTSTPHAIAIQREESNELAWVDIDRAAELLHGPESHRVIRKIERLFARGVFR